LYPRGGASKVLDHVERNRGAVRHRAQQLGVRCETVAAKARVPWLPHEDRVLRRHYPRGGWTAVAEVLPQRTAGSIEARARRLAVRARRAWTADEDRVLRRVYVARGARAVAEQIDRTETAIYQHAHVLRVRRKSR
jgi:hypothetical protein